MSRLNAPDGVKETLAIIQPHASDWTYMRFLSNCSDPYLVKVGRVDPSMRWQVIQLLDPCHRAVGSILQCGVQVDLISPLVHRPTRTLSIISHLYSHRQQYWPQYGRFAGRKGIGMGYMVGVAAWLDQVEVVDRRVQQWIPIQKNKPLVSCSLHSFPGFILALIIGL